MANPVYITITSSGTTTRAVNLDTRMSPFNATVAVTYASTSMTATYGVEYTLEDEMYLAAIGSTLAVKWLADANMPAGTSSGATTTYSNPVAAVRCTVTAISSSSVTFKVLQGGPP